MIDPFLEKHSNPETFNAEPVFIFTGKAIVPAKKGPPPEAGNKKDAPPASTGEEKLPPAQQPDEGTRG